MSGSTPDQFRWAPARPPVVAARSMVATSQPTATLAGQQMLARGGNAVDAAIAAAAVLGVTEPMSTGIGGDAFAIVHRDGQAIGLDAAGPAPRHADAPLVVPASGPRSVNVPGAVAGWAALGQRFGRFGLDTCLQPAIDIAQAGFAVAFHTARYWAEAQRPPPSMPAPGLGARVRFPDQAATLRAIAEQGPEALYAGEIAARIAAASWLAESDLAAYTPRWVTPLAHPFRDVQVLELPPPTQGVAALEALALVQYIGDGLPNQVRAVSLALEDAFAHVRDGADVGFLLSEEHLRARAAGTPQDVTEPGGGTVYLCAVDENRLAVSFIQSLFMGFGSGVLVPGTGIVLNNRAACFGVEGRVAPGQRPYHTLMPGLLLHGDGGLIGPFGVMGGFIQAQAHVQFVIAALEDGLDPQAALDRGRFRVDRRQVHLEPPLWKHADELNALGYDAVRSRETSSFGGGQAIFVRGDALLGGSDARKDGVAAGS
jgi:gamma-glutamyltranspeptidase / glutathione hydrolase